MNDVQSDGCEDELLTPVPGASAAVAECPVNRAAMTKCETMTKYGCDDTTAEKCRRDGVVAMTGITKTKHDEEKIKRSKKSKITAERCYNAKINRKML